MPTKAKECTFVVIGTGTFPRDMLRYDNARAATPADQKIIDAEYEDESGPLWEPGSRFGGSRLKVNRVTLVTANDSAPTRDRWQSFMWRVVAAN